MAIDIVDFPIKNGGSFHCYVTVYQRVTIPKNPPWMLLFVPRTSVMEVLRQYFRRKSQDRSHWFWAKVHGKSTCSSPKIRPTGHLSWDFFMFSINQSCCHSKANLFQRDVMTSRQHAAALSLYFLFFIFGSINCSLISLICPGVDHDEGTGEVRKSAGWHPDWLMLSVYNMSYGLCPRGMVSGWLENQKVPIMPHGNMQSLEATKQLMVSDLS